MITDTPPPGGTTGESAAHPPLAGLQASRQARRIAVNSLLPFGATIAARVLAWVTAVIMARTLGPDGSGAYAFAVNLWLYASIISDFGLGTWLTREVAREPAKARVAVRLSLGLRLLLSAVAFAALVSVALGYHLAGLAGWEIVATAALLGLGLLPGALSAAGTALFNAHELMVFPAAVQLAGALVTTAGGAAVLLAGGGIVGLGWVSLAVNLVIAAVFAYACRRRFFSLGATLDTGRQRALARETFPLMLNSLLNNVFFRIDIQILQARGSAVVGYYANAYKVVDAAGAVPSTFVLALFPLLSRRAGAAGDRHGLLSVYALALKLLLAVALALAIVLTYAAHGITLYSWGPDFLPDSAIALQVLIWFLPLSFFNGLTQYVLIALGLQARITRAFALAAIFNVVANLWLIPLYSYVAAAAITIATEVVLLVPFLFALRGHVDLAALLRAGARTLPPAVALTAIVLLPLPAAAPITVAGGLAVYAVMAWRGGTFSARERDVLRSIVRRA